MSNSLVDHLDRQTAINTLDQSVFLSAGAGTGKSSTLVGRIEATLNRGDTNMREIVAITFTEKAAAELRHRIRAALEKGSSDPLLAAALKEVDGAQIGTIHSFAQYILRRFSLEAGLPLGFKVCGEVEAALARRQRARDVIASMSDLRRIDHTLRLYKVKMASLLDLVQNLDASSLRIADHHVEAIKGPDIETLRMKAMSGIARFMTEFEADCTDMQDRLFLTLGEKSTQLLDILGSADEDRLATLHLQRNGKRLEQFKLGNIGSKKAFGNEPKEWRHAWGELEESVNAVLVAPLEIAIRELLEHSHTELKKAREDRRRLGEIEFDDLLYMAEQLVRENEGVRSRLYADFKVLMIDEFQDTDPLQWKLIRAVTSNSPAPDARPEPGRLILVGDPKQAIYSFRGADVETFNGAQREFVELDPTLGLSLSLKSNFRTVKPIISWVNETFSVAFGRQVGYQVTYEPLDPVHDPESEDPGPSVVVLRETHIPEELAPKQVEAALVAGQIQRAIAEGWMITEPSREHSRAYARPARYRDMAVLFPTRSSLDALLNAFDDAAIPYRSSDAALIFDRPVVLGTVHALRFITDSTNELSLWLTLKSPLFGCTDQELKDYHRQAQSWRRVPDDFDPENRVAAALNLLIELRRFSRDSQPVELINELFLRIRVFEILMHTPRGNFDADALRMLAIHAQMWQADGGQGLIEYVETLEMLKEDSSRAQFPMADDLQDDAIELMTVFGAKGLEFPIVFLAGMTTKPKAIKPVLGISKDKPIEFCLNKTATSIGYANWYEGEYNPFNDAERMRVLYVACTRARDHLVVSLVAGTTTKTKGSPGALLRDAVNVSDDDVSEVPDFQVPARRMPYKRLETPVDWTSQLENARSRSHTPWVALPSGTGAIALGVAGNTDGNDAPDPLDDDSTQRMNLSTRDGAAFGQVVHAAMDYIVKSQEAASEELVTKAVESGLGIVAGGVSRAEALATVKAILASPTIQEALRAPRKWPELYLATPALLNDVEVVEGLADLVFEHSSGGFVVVDYKTDQTISPKTLDHYRDQLACYAEILKRVTGSEVLKRVIVHAPDSQAKEYELN